MVGHFALNPMKPRWKKKRTFCHRQLPVQSLLSAWREPKWLWGRACRRSFLGQMVRQHFPDWISYDMYNRAKPCVFFCGLHVENTHFYSEAQQETHLIFDTFPFIICYAGRLRLSLLLHTLEVLVKHGPPWQRWHCDPMLSICLQVIERFRK